MSIKPNQNIEDICKSALAAMEEVGLPMEKFVAFTQPEFVVKPVLFSNPLQRTPRGPAPQPDTSVSLSTKQKPTI